MFTSTTSSSRSKSIVTAIEALEDRQLRSASPLNFSGHFVNSPNTTSEIDVDLKSSHGKYTGDINMQGEQFAITATEKRNVLSGIVDDSNGQAHTFKASLRGKTLSVSVDQTVTKFQKQAVNPNALVQQTGSEFQFAVPRGWKANEGQAGIVISSNDHKMEADVMSGTFNGTVTAHDLVQAAGKAGDKVLMEKALPSTTVNGIRIEEESVLLSFKAKNGQTFAAGMVIGTTTSGGKTHVTLEGGRALARGFGKSDAVLTSVLKSIKPLANAASAAHSHNYAKVSDWWDGWNYGYDYTYTNGFYDPGVYGDWSYGDNYWVSPYVAAEQSTVAYQSSVYDASNDAFDAYISE